MHSVHTSHTFAYRQIFWCLLQGNAAFALGLSLVGLVGMVLVGVGVGVVGLAVGERATFPCASQDMRGFSCVRSLSMQFRTPFSGPLCASYRGSRLCRCPGRCGDGCGGPGTETGAQQWIRCC